MEAFNVLVIVATSFLVQSGAQELPLRTSSLINSTCPSNVPKENMNDLVHRVNSILDDRYGPECGGAGWNRIASIDMTQPNSQCPAGWTQVSSPITACSRGSARIASATFSTGGNTYSNVCGRVIGYQLGQTDGFGNYIANLAYNEAGNLDQTIDGTYVDGVSITRGSPRQHIWSFAAGESETSTSISNKLCPCSASNYPYSLPPYMGNEYFCDSGNTAASSVEGTFYGSRALWTGQGCASTSRCCEFNRPPWFYVTLAEATNNDLEVRLLSNQVNNSEDVLVTIVELYTK